MTSRVIHFRSNTDRAGLFINFGADPGDLARRFKGRYPVPEYVSEFLLGRYCASTDDAEIQEGLSIVERQMRELSPEMRQKLTHDNAAALYRLG